jgi:hypothetical protein
LAVAVLVVLRQQTPTQCKAQAQHLETHPAQLRQPAAVEVEVELLGLVCKPVETVVQVAAAQQGRAQIHKLGELEQPAKAMLEVLVGRIMLRTAVVVEVVEQVPLVETLVPPPPLPVEMELNLR